MRAILLSIKPEYVRKILDGEKRFEYRRHLAKENISLAYLYETSPCMKVVASAQIVQRLKEPPMDLWKKTRTMSGISRDAFFSYFNGCDNAFAYELDNIRVFGKPKLLSELGVRTAPQSFMYIDVDN